MLHLPPYATFPEIIAGDLILREVKPDDMNALMEISFYDAKPAQTQEEAATMQSRINADYQSGTSIHWCIVDKATQQVMGTLGYYRGFENSTGELGCVLKPAFRGKGIMSKAIQLASEFGLNNMGLKKVIAVTTRQNTKAINLLERLNFVQVNVLEDDGLEYQYQRINS